MADLDALMREITTGLMLWHAQSITALEIKNEVADVADPPVSGEHSYAVMRRIGRWEEAPDV